MAKNKQEEVKVLFAWASPFAMRVVLALELKGIPYELCHEDLGKKSKLLLESNPVHKKVPVLLHNGNPVSESSIIVQYIDEAWPQGPQIFPQDSFERAQARFWGDFLDNESIAPIIRSAKAVPQANEDFLENCLLLEIHLASKVEGPFFGGKEMNYVDIMIAPYEVWLPVMSGEFGLELPLQKCPKMFKLLENLKEHRVAKAGLPTENKLEGRFMDRFNN